MADGADILDPSLAPADFAAFVDGIRQTGGPAAALVPLLSVSHPVYRDRPVGAATRMRAYALAALGETGLPDAALPYVIEILETSYRPMLVAAAARAVRGMEAPDPALAAHLARAVPNIWQVDQPVSFAAFDLNWPLPEYATALTEILDTLAGMGGAARPAVAELRALATACEKRFNPRIHAALAECFAKLEAAPAAPKKTCCGAMPKIETPACGAAPDLGAVEVEDQDGERFPWQAYFGGRPGVVAFFYSTCMNPKKCVQTVYTLIGIDRALADAGLEGAVRVAAITYDPVRDTPLVLRQYGASKGMRFDTDCRMLRVPRHFQAVIEAFDLGVNYAGDQVSDHQIELYLLDRDGRIADRFLRLQSDPAAVVDRLRALAAPASRSEHLRMPAARP